MPAVYQYVWRDYGLPAYRGWILTLKDNHAIVLVAFVTTFIAYSQSRAWKVERDIFNTLFSAKVQLPITDHHQETPTSQGEAISILIRTLLSQRNFEIHQFRRNSPWIGLIALLNLMAFVALGIVIPWSLAGGSSTSTLVRSAATSECLSSDARPIPLMGHPLERVAWTTLVSADVTYRQCWLEFDFRNRSCHQLDGISTRRPDLIISRVDYCPFVGNTCLKEIRPITLEYTGLTLRDYGLHSKSNSKVSINRRLTCAHLSTTKFIKKSLSTNCAKTLVSFCDLRSSDPNILAIDIWSCGMLINACGEDQSPPELKKTSL